VRFDLVDDGKEVVVLLALPVGVVAGVAVLGGREVVL
jgi:hypothetical protein